MPKPDRLESPLVRDAINEVRRRGGYIIKLHGEPSQEKGPDLFICYRGHFIGAEAKKLGEEPTPLQYDILEQINRAGGFGIWFDNLPGLINFLDTIDRTS